MSDKIKIIETTKEYELKKSDIVPNETNNTWWNRTAGFLDRLRVIPRLLMLAYCWVFYSSTSWFMSLADPTNSQAAFISTIVGAGAAFFGLYVGKDSSSINISKKKRD